MRWTVAILVLTLLGGCGPTLGLTRLPDPGPTHGFTIVQECDHVDGALNRVSCITSPRQNATRPARLFQQYARDVAQRLWRGEIDEREANRLLDAEEDALASAWRDLPSTIPARATTRVVVERPLGEGIITGYRSRLPAY